MQNFRSVECKQVVKWAAERGFNLERQRHKPPPTPPEASPNKHAGLCGASVCKRKKSSKAEGMRIGGVKGVLKGSRV